MNIRQDPIIPDIGFVAGTDPVAVDAASLDLIREKTGKDLSDRAYSDIDPWHQIRHGEKIGLGKKTYELVHVK